MDGDKGGIEGGATDSPTGQSGYSGKAPAMSTVDIRMIQDLGRLLRYASTAKSVEIPKESLAASTAALQAAQSMLSENVPMTPEAELALFRAVDDMAPRVFPATTASLEIVEVMEVGWGGGSDRQSEIRNKVKRLINLWIVAALFALFLVFFTQSLEQFATKEAAGTAASMVNLARFFSPIVLGSLGACAFILRTMLTGLANQTFVLREGTTYLLRLILGAILGLIIPRLVDSQWLSSEGGTTSAADVLKHIAVPFLAGYAVEPMFAALDNLVQTVKDAVSRSPGSAGSPGK